MAVEAMVSQGFAGEFVYIQIFQNEDGEEGKRRKDEKTKRRKETKYSVVIYNSSHKSGHSSGLVRLRLNRVRCNNEGQVNASVALPPPRSTDRREIASVGAS